MKKNNTYGLAVFSLTICLGTTMLNSCTKSNPYSSGNGRVSFWSKISNEGNTDITIDGETKTLKVYNDSTPDCKNDNLAYFVLPKGNYTYSAKNAAGKTWDGSVDIEDGGCTTFELRGGSAPSNYDNQGTITVRSRNLTISFYDGATVDHDIMSIVFNGTTIASNIEIYGSKQSFTLNNIPLDSWLGIIAISEGDISPCTPDIDIYDGYTTQHITIRSLVTSPGSYAIKVKL